MPLVNRTIDLSWVDEMVSFKQWVTIHGHPVNIGGESSGSGGGGGGRDAISKQLFDGTPPKVIVPAAGRADLDAASGRLFGRVLDDAEYADLVGAPSGARLKVYSGKTNGKEHITIGTNADGYSDRQTRRIYRDSDGKLVISNDSFFTDDTFPPGGGTRVFAKQVQTARALGVSRIVTEGAGSSLGDANGYYTWPRFGYDGDLSTETRAVLPNHLQGAQRVSDLMKTQVGRDWWRQNGESISLNFDLAPSSLSSQVLHAYLTERQVSL